MICKAKYKMCIVVTMSSSVDNWIKPFIDDYLLNGFDLTIICNSTETYQKDFNRQYPDVNFVSYPFPRGFYVKKTLQSIKFLNSFFAKNKFDLVQYSTPNASFYASITAKRNKIPNRLYCQWGMTFMTAKGVKRIILKFIEKTICRKSTIIEPDSIGNREFCIKNRFYSTNKSRVIWNGSAKGLDLVKFDFSKKEMYKKELIKVYPELKDSFVVGFVGRLGADKGCNELFESFKVIEKSIPNSKLLFVGPIEKENTIKPELLEYFYTNSNIIKTNRVSNVEKYYSLMNVFVLPSYREGFGMSVVEAEAFGVPVIVTKYPGPEGGMIDGQTGYLINRFSAEEITERIIFLYKNKDIFDALSANAIQYAKCNFNFETFRKKYIKDRLLIVGDTK